MPKRYLVEDVANVLDVGIPMDKKVKESLIRRVILAIETILSESSPGDKLMLTHLGTISVHKMNVGKGQENALRSASLSGKSRSKTVRFSFKPSIALKKEIVSRING